jgi:hypothetical protein
MPSTPSPSCPSTTPSFLLWSWLLTASARSTKRSRSSFASTNGSINQTHICALCGLFGVHKNHKIIANSELEVQNRALIAEIQAAMDTNLLFTELKEGQTFTKMLQSLVKSALSAAKGQLLTLYNVY